MHTQNVNVRTAAQESSRKIGGTFDFELQPMRGLTIRIEWGQARVLRLIDAQKAACEMAEALWEAEYCGHIEYNGGKESPPGMFADSPELVEAWWSGWRRAATLDDMAGCPGCHNDSGEPCSYHD